MATQVTLNSGSVDSAGSLALKTNGTTTAVTINASQGVEFNAGAVGTPSITTTGDTNTGIFFPAADTIAFSEGGAEAMRINSSGNVGIGTSSPLNKLQIKTQTNGNAAFANSTSVAGGVRISCYNDAGNASSPFELDASSLQFNIAVVEKMRLDSSGNLLVGTINNPSGFRLNVSGTVTASGSVSFPQSNNDTTANAANMNIQADGYLRRSTSALKYKQDIRDLESMDIGLLRPVRYKSKCVGDDQTKDHLGLIADEAADAGFEELVTRGAENEVEGFQYERLTVVLLKAIQELKAIIDTQAARITALEGTQP